MEAYLSPGHLIGNLWYFMNDPKIIKVFQRFPATLPGVPRVHSIFTCKLHAEGELVNTFSVPKTTPVKSKLIAKYMTVNTVLQANNSRSSMSALFQLPIPL